ncbi:PspC domain-containing protein [Nocardioides sp. BGMRC 2183]|jgi:phage shock protein C|nr:PspC domain-containing protein [Nocardioides sp. BGMRC 2183]
MNNEYPQPYAPTGPRRLTRSRIDRKLGGVCGGAAVYAGIDPTAMRLLMVAATVFTGGAAILLYIAGWILMPEE